uniref:Uncharacterized protein n=1 Tax=viral metagenome TaxID=1070528 RepID=A0A6C0BPB9_9ZZZZ
MKDSSFCYDHYLKNCNEQESYFCTILNYFNFLMYYFYEIETKNMN